MLYPYVVPTCSRFLIQSNSHPWNHRGGHLAQGTDFSCGIKGGRESWLCTPTTYNLCWYQDKTQIYDFWIVQYTPSGLPTKGGAMAQHTVHDFKPRDLTIVDFNYFVLCLQFFFTFRRLVLLFAESVHSQDQQRCI